MGILTGRVVCLSEESAECDSFRSQGTMADEDKPLRNKAKSKAGEPTRTKMKAESPTPRPFDMWLHKQLHAMYDEIAAEPLPDDLLGLIDKDKKENGGGGTPDKN